MKKTAAFIFALIIAASTFSCSSKAGEKQKNDVTTLSVDKNFRTSYKTEDLALPKGMQYGYFMAPYDGGKKYLTIGSVDFQTKFWTSGSDLADFTQVDFPDFIYGQNYNIAVADDGTVVTFVNDVSYGDLPAPDYSSPDYDEQLYEESAEYSLKICTYSIGGKLLSSADVDEKFDFKPDKYMNIGVLATDGKFLITEVDGSYELFDTEGNYYDTLSGDDIRVAGAGRDSSGRLICAVEAGDDMVKFCTINEKGELSEPDTAYEFGETIHGAITPAYGDHTMYIRTISGIYGIRSDNGSMEMLFDVHGAGLKAHEMNGISRDDDGNFIVLRCDYEHPTALTRYIAVDADELEEMPVITVGFLGSTGEDNRFSEKYISSWNGRSDKDFRVEMKFYEIKIDSNGKKPADLSIFDQISKDAISGDLPDVILCQSNGGFGDVNLYEKNMVCDLYEFMDKDEVYSRDYFIPNVLKCFETNGKLYGIANRFNIIMKNCAKTRLVGTQDNWTIEKFLDLTLNPPIKMEYGGNYDSMIYRANGWINSPLSWNDWIDLKNGTCSFDSPTFVRFLEYCAEAPRVDADFDNWEDPTANMSSSEIQEYMKDANRRVYRAYIDDTSLFDTLYISTYESYLSFVRGQFNGESVTFTTPPTMESFDKVMTINASSDKKDLAWDYIKSFMSYETYTSECYRDERGYRACAGFPVTKDGLKYQESFARTNYTDYSQLPETKDDPDWKDYKGFVYMVDHEDYSYNIKLGEMTDEDVAAVNSVIDTMQPKNYMDLTDDKLDEIADEELRRYFNGSCTAEQCAEAMQSRLTIYLSERYSS